jgi:hypothetical protein
MTLLADINWDDVLEWIAKNTIRRTGEPRA